MINNKLVLASTVAFAMLAVAATTMVTHETYARSWTCNPGSHLVTEPNGLPRCVPDTNTTK
ncbi:MAG: hypothetical protein WAK17_07500 [Candidatus Nitrosopolaris sp.]|jgi:hypothetical protein